MRKNCNAEEIQLSEYLIFFTTMLLGQYLNLQTLGYESYIFVGFLPNNRIVNKRMTTSTRLMSDGNLVERPRERLFFSNPKHQVLITNSCQNCDFIG